MALELPISFGSCSPGHRIHLVGRLQCWDASHDSHLMSAVHDGSTFHACGLLNGPGEVFSLMNVEFRKQFPIPMVKIDDRSHVLCHDRPSWNSMRDLIELCSGFGGMSQGMLTSGFVPAVGVDFNAKMTRLYGVQCSAPTITADVNDLSTLMQIWNVAPGAGTLVAGFACQPFSRLGDQLGSCDARAQCLKGILAIAFYLQVQAVILECVLPALDNSFVKEELKRFLDASGFTSSHCELQLHDIWPMRRPRAWWLLTSQLIGRIPLFSWPRSQVLTKVRQVLPSVQPWDIHDEDALALGVAERHAFGCDDDSFHRYLLNFETCAPCALHSWGSQLVGCECGCRLSGLSEHRLREKGLFGCLVHSCPTESKASLLRHLHPNEVMMLCGFDPVVDFGPCPRLTLAAAGQMASPLQTAWIFGALDERLLKLQGFVPQFSSDARLQAFVSWVLMRGRQVWPAEIETVHDQRLLSLMNFWKEVSALSMAELMHPPRWPELHPSVLNIASVLDALIRRSQSDVPFQPKPAEFDIPMTHVDDSEDDAPTPWFETVHNEFDMLPESSPDECLVIFHHEFAAPVKISVAQGCTIQHLILAHSQLVGGLKATYACDRNGCTLPFTHVLQVGQVICIRCEDRSADCSSAGSEELPVAHSRSEKQGSCFANAPNMHAPATISPTACWSEVPCAADSSTFAHFGPTDSGTCEVPEQVLPDCESWISAAPLLGLSGHQFLNLHVPVVTCTKHLWALRHQFLQALDRVAVLKQQDGIWSDDEFRFHIAQLINMSLRSGVLHEGSSLFCLDPLLLTGWVHHGTSLCHQWGIAHPEIKMRETTVLSACMIDKHWIPVVLTPKGPTLQFSTWDAPTHDHGKLDLVVDTIANALGFTDVCRLRHQRLFLSSDKCGALAMAFLHHSVSNSMLPTTLAEVEVVHTGYRDAYVHAVENCSIAHRPWVWGAADAEEDSFPNEPGQSSDSGPSLNQALTAEVSSFSHQCMDKDKRLDLLHEKGKMWGDDEIRFHLMHLMNHPSNVTNSRYPTIPGFVMMDPLLLSTWDSIGQGLCEAWCRRNKCVPDQGFHVVAIFLQDEHWFPVWIVPHGFTLVAHTVADELTNPDGIRPILDVLVKQFGFRDGVVHTFPPALPVNNMCGAAAIAFLGHIMVAAELPADLESLGYYHFNMKACFVQALFSGKCCICPVVWGSGPSQVSKALSEELRKHGVPDNASDQRAQQAIKAIGADSIQEALSSKNVWRSLKALGNNVKFQFLLPAELESIISSNKGLPIGKRIQNGGPKSRPKVFDAVDPSKLALPEGIFQVFGHPVPQISVKQIGPLAFGIVLITLEEAMPYLKAGKPVSSEPLAIAVFMSSGAAIDTCLPHTKMMLPCVCIANQEPLLTEVVIQLGSNFIEKQVLSTAIPLEQLDVATVKIMVYRDELPLSWDDFVASPIKHMVRTFPLLRRCTEEDCKCDAWHNRDQLPLKDPIMDVWRRQFLRSGFKSAPALKADIFSVCLRIPMVILQALLEQSGASGAYTEPRTPDGKEVMEEFVVVWAPKMSASELSHLKQTNPTVIGLARLGDRRGLRVRSEKAQMIHEVLRPEAAFLPSGPKTQFAVGPFPWGSDRNAINKAMKQAGWPVKALQPVQPVPGRGSMWILQAVDSPPQLIFHMSHGEVVVSKHKPAEGGVKFAQVASVGSASTLSLCSAVDSGDTDPWIASDPWGQYNKGKIQPHATPAHEGLQQLEERIQSAVLSKLPASAVQTQVPDRLSCLETQVQQLMSKNHELEGQFADFSNQSTQQFALVQQQIQQQSQSFHGQFESHTQSVQAMFESQMHQIRTLLSKRPRDETPME